MGFEKKTPQKGNLGSLRDSPKSRKPSLENIIIVKKTGLKNKNSSKSGQAKAPEIRKKQCIGEKPDNMLKNIES